MGSRTRPHALPLFTLLASLTWSKRASAVEYDIDTQTLAQAWQWRSPWGGPVISRRTLNELVTVSLVHRGGPRDPVARLHFRLRFDNDFGDACDGIASRCLEETAPERRTDYVPGLVRRSIDLPYAYLDVSNLLRGALEARVGRMVHVDALGFFAFDGARLRVALGSYAIAEVYAGLEVRNGFALSSGRFERDGVSRADRSSWPLSLAPSVKQNLYAPVVAAALETPAFLQTFARATYRRVWTSEGIAEEKLGASVESSVHPLVQLSGRTVYSLPQRQLSELRASVSVRTERNSLRAEAQIQRIRPSFDLTAIWSAFWVDAVDEGSLTLIAVPSPSLSLRTWINARRYATAEGGPSLGAASTADSWLGGGGTSVSYFPRRSLQLELRAQGEGAAFAARGGLDAQVLFAPWGQRLLFDARASLWANHDPSRIARSGAFSSLVAGASLALGPGVRLHADVQHDHSASVGHRIRVGLSLVIGVQP
ncbi:MAG: hypothetical protein Q8Q09_23170 [Deltaproteobacteria bacterium]|nr:hypothetical protein [Deltaproteobacteria bacterium]